MDAQDENLVKLVRRLVAAQDWPTSYRISQEWVEPPHELHARLDRCVQAGWLVVDQSGSPDAESEYYAPGPQSPSA